MNQHRPAGSPVPQREDVEDSAPRFSVCIPVYNDATWLPAAIESVLGQSYSGFELVIGDNVSTQAIGDIAAASADPRVRYHRWSEHVPTYENFNRTMSLARNDWVVPLGADDRLDPRCLEVLAVQIDSARANPRPLVMVVTASRRVDIDGTGQIASTMARCASSRFRRAIPADLWLEVRAEGLIEMDAPLPGEAFNGDRHERQASETVGPAS